MLKVILPYTRDKNPVSGTFGLLRSVLPCTDPLSHAVVLYPGTKGEVQMWVNIDPWHSTRSYGIWQEVNTIGEARKQADTLLRKAGYYLL